MAGHNSKDKTVPTYLQPNTVLSSRAAIFDDEFSNKPKQSNRTGYSKRDKDRHSNDTGSDSEDDEASKSILEKLYGQLQGSIEIKDTDMERSKRSVSEDTDLSEDNLEPSEAEKDRNNDLEDTDGAMEFRLFSTQDTPTAIVLNQKEPEVLYVHRERAELDESPESERMQQIAEAAIDSTVILRQSKMPWERSFFAHKVIHITREQQSSSDPKKVRKSKRKREWEKKLKAGLIDPATIEATARKVKVAESWGQVPYLVRKGLDRYTIDAGTETRSSGGGRGGRGGRGARGGTMRGGRGGRGGSRGGFSGADRVSVARPSTQDGKGGSDKKDAKTVSLGKRSYEGDNSSRPAGKKSKASNTDSSTIQSGATLETTKVMTLSSGTVGSIAAKSKASGQLTSSKEPKSPLPPKKLKAKPTSKLDNIMAILTGK